MRRIALAVLLGAAAGPALAGIPDLQTVTCPVGGEEFTVTGTLSCTVFDRVGPALAPDTSCDWVERLPQCPGNRLPMFKEFSATDVERLAALIPTPEYAAAAEHSRYYLAWWLADRLGESNTETRAMMLLAGLWWDEERTLSDPAHMAAIREEFVRFAQTAEGDAAMFAPAVAAWLVALGGDKAAAEPLLAKAKAASEAHGDVATRHIEAVEACIASGDPQSCRPRGR